MGIGKSNPTQRLGLLPTCAAFPRSSLVGDRSIVPMAGESAGRAGVINAGCVAIYPWSGGFARVTGRFREVCEPEILTLDGGAEIRVLCVRLVQRSVGLYKGGYPSA